MGSGEPVEIDVEAYTDDQHAMLCLLDYPREVREPVFLGFWGETPAGRMALSNDPPNGVIRKYRCPVVEVLGRQRAILPNGDLHEYREHTAAPIEDEE